MKRITVLLVASVVWSCDKDVAGESDGAVLGDSSYEAIDYRLTSESYKKWLVAQQALDSAGVRPMERINVRDVADEDIARVTQSLENQAAAKAAIESAGLTVRDFVLTTIALAQSWDAVNGPRDRVLGARPENLDFLRAQAATDSAIRTRPPTGAGIVDDSPTIDGSDSDSDTDKDSDSDSRGKGKDKDHRKGNRGRG